MESMSNTPMIMPRITPKYGGMNLSDVILHDGLTDAYGKMHMGVCGEDTAEKLKISREEQDEYAISSYERSASASEEGRFKEEIIPVTIKGIFLKSYFFLLIFQLLGQESGVNLTQLCGKTKNSEKLISQN